MVSFAASDSKGWKVNIVVISTQKIILLFKKKACSYTTHYTPNHQKKIKKNKSCNSIQCKKSKIV